MLLAGRRLNSQHKVSGIWDDQVSLTLAAQRPDSVCCAIVRLSIVGSKVKLLTGTEF